jgi:hypothetical protein
MPTVRHAGLWLGVALSLLVHGSVLIVLLLQPEPDIGRNREVRTHPVRERVVAIRLAEAGAAAAPRTADSVAAPVEPSPAEPPAAEPEGAIEAAPERLAESSERYFTRAELDNKPRFINAPDLGTELSPLLEGRAVLLFYLNETGAVDRIEVQENTLPESMMVQLQAQREQLRFTPGSKNGVEVKSVIRYEIVLEKQARAPDAVLPGASR